MPDEPSSAPAALRQMITSFWVSSSIHAVAELGVADAVKEGERDVAEIARIVGADESALFRLLRAVASVGIFKETTPRHFAPTPMSELLRRDVPGSLRGLALYSAEVMVPAWGEVVHAVKTGQTSVEKIFGSPIFPFLDSRPEVAAHFDQAMTGQTMLVGRAVAAAYDFTGFRTIVDVGGGKGALLASILPSAPQARGVNFDQPAVIERARAFISAAALGERCELAAGDFFSAVPAGGDAYLLKYVLHDWPDDDCVAILRNVTRAMREGAKVLVIEAVIPPGNDPHPGKFMDINMLVITGGRERTADEYRDLLERSGLRMTRIVPAHPLGSVIEAVRSNQPS